jgi:hypothetical protein
VAIRARLGHTTTVFAALAVAAALAHTGLYGQVRVDPGMPVCRLGEPCWKPAPGAVLSFNRDGHRVARTTADSHGFYRVALRAGTYRVRVERPRAIVTRPLRVVVPRARYKLLNVSVDVGIR